MAWPKGRLQTTQNGPNCPDPRGRRPSDLKPTRLQSPLLRQIELRTSGTQLYRVNH